MSTLTKKSTFSIYVLSFLGAVGNSFQNFLAFLDFLKGVGGTSLLFNKVLSGVFNFCGGLINLAINVGLLKGFLERLKGKKPKQKLTPWQTFSYWTGFGVFIITGVLFALTAYAFGTAMGPLAGLAIAAGIFVGMIMMIQELETWLRDFDEGKEILSPIAIFKKWCSDLDAVKMTAFVISVGNVMALSLLFTAGLTLFLTTVGVPAFAAAVAGFVVAFTFGAFTEFYFYNGFITDFCINCKSKWTALKESKWASLGMLSIGINALVNGVLCYTGVYMLGGLLCAAHIAFPVLPLAIIASLFAGLASLLLGADFWIDVFKKKEASPVVGSVEKGTEVETNALLSSEEEETLHSSLGFGHGARQVMPKTDDTKEEAPGLLIFS